MIAEFALTPAVFDQGAHPDPFDWQLWLTTLGHRMFPQPKLCPVVVTDLSGLWGVRVREATGRITDHRARGIATRLLTQIGSRLVRRTLPPGAVRVGEEAWWAKSACAAADVERIERVVASTACRTGLAATHPTVRELREVEDDPFWENVTAEWSPEASVDVQTASLHKLCVYGEFVWLATP